MEKKRPFAKQLKPFLLTLLLFAVLSSKSQMSGVYTVPGSYTSIVNAAVALINVGVSGPVTINIASGHIESPPGGIFIPTITGASAANTITFKKNGTGANPLIMAYSGGVGTPSSNTNQDGIFGFYGTDHIIMDGIDLLDTNTANPATMEFGYGLFKTSSTDGCQNITIKNCVITLNRNNSATGNGSSESGSKGIYVSDAKIGQYTQPMNVTAASGSHSNNKFYGNVIQNCHIGIALRGFDNQGYTPYSDLFNDVGGISAATGNTIVNFGGGPGNVNAYGIKPSYQYSLNASFNTIINNNGNGASPGTDLYAIYNYNYNAAQVTINSNTIALSSVSTNSTLSLNGIRTSAQSTFMPFVSPTITMNNNVFSSVSSINAKCLFFTNYVNVAKLNMNNNIIKNVNVAYGKITMFYTYLTSTCNINSNTVTGIYTDSSSLLAIDLDFVKQISCSDNFFGNISTSTLSPNTIEFFEGDWGSVHAINNNTLTNLQATTIRGFNFYSDVKGATYSITNNQVTNLRAVAGFSFNATNIGIIGVSNPNGSANVLISGNTIYSLTCFSSPAFSNNPAGISGIGVSEVSNLTISNNKIYSFYSNQNGTGLRGIGLNGSFSNPSSLYGYIHNNIIGDFESTGSNNNFLGIRVDRQHSTIAYNTIYLDGPNTGSNTISHNIYVYYSSSTPVISTIRNNILYNNTPATGTGTARCIYMSTITAYGAGSDRNILYIGTPAANRIYATINTSSYSNFGTFKNVVSPREVQTFTENTVFATTNGALPNTLYLDPLVTTLAEGGAGPMSSITDDYAGTLRHATNPDIGAWEGNFLGFDRIAPLIVNSGFTTLPCGNFTTRTFTAHITDSSGVASGGFAPRLYYKVNSGSYTSVQGVLSSGTSSNGIWTFNLAYSASAGSTISYYLAIQDQTTFINLAVIGTFGGVGTNVNSISSPPSPFTYVLQNYPVITANGGSICLGKVFQINPNGASTYTYSSGSSTVSPVANTSYSITGTSSSGCPATNTAVINVTVLPLPTITVNSGSICYLKSFTIVAGGASSYTYSSGSPVISPKTNTTVFVTGKSAAGCISSNTAIASVTVNPLPVLSITGSNTLLCLGETLNLTAVGALSYTWNTGATTAMIAETPGDTTTYFVIGTDVNNCSATKTITQNVSNCTGILKNGKEPVILVFPNPGTGIINIVISDTEQPSPAKEKEIQIINLLGEVIFSEIIIDGNSVFDIRNFANGIYTLRIFENGHAIFVTKLVKE